MLSAEKLLLSALTDSIHGKIPQYDCTQPADEIFTEAVNQGVLPLVLQGEYKTENDFRHTALQHGIKGIKIEEQHAHLHKILTSAGIPYVILKGCASGYYYPNPTLRCYGDVDFLINPADVDRTANLLLSEGFTDAHHSNEIHSIFNYNGVRFEMHISPPGIPNGTAGEILKKYLDNIIEESRTVTTEFGDINIPSEFHHGLVLILHTVHHLTGEGIGLRHLCDWAVFMGSFTENEFRSMFEEKLKKCGLSEFTKILSAVCVRYLDCKGFTFTNDVDRNITSEMIEDIFRGGNLGQKLPSRAHEAMIISDRGKNGVGNKNKLIQLISSANSIVYNKWKIAKKIKIILPFGWLFFGGRYIIRSLTGKRPEINIKDTVNSADKRIQLYKNFHLYETGVIDGK